MSGGKRSAANRFTRWTPLLFFCIFFLPTLCFPTSRSAQNVTAVQRNSKIIAPQSVLEDFEAGKSSTRIIVSLRQPAVAMGLQNLKTENVKRQRRQAVRNVQDWVINAMGSHDVRHPKRFKYLFGFSTEVTLQGLEDLMNHPEVLSVEKDEIVQTHLAQGISLMNAAGPRSSYKGSGLSIAMCDTGIDYNHLMLGGGGFPNAKVIGGYDVGDNDNDPMDQNGHGTACAGIAAGSLGNNEDYIGGVAYDAKLYAIKITYGNGSSAYTSDMIEGWEWCITHQNDDPDNPIMIISTSFGLGRYYSACDHTSSAMTAAAANAVSAGITVFVSSGNEGYCDSLTWPACISDVISVGGVYDADIGSFHPCVSSASCADKISTGDCSGYYVVDSTAAGKVAAYSNTASILDLLAPANHAHTTDISGSGGFADGDYHAEFGGTSAACPYAAGAAAVLQSAAVAVTGSFLTPGEIKQRLVETGDPVTDEKVSITKPVINLAAAIETLATPNAPPTADAGPDQTVTEGATVTLDGSQSSDPDDGIAAYQWSQTAGSTVSLSDNVAVKPEFTAPEVVTDDDTLTFQLTVTDSEGLEASDLVTVTVEGRNSAPRADAGPDQTVNIGDVVTLDGAGSSDSDDDIAHYQWIQTSGTEITLSDVTVVSPFFTAPDVGSEGDTLIFELTVTDQADLVSTDACRVHISAVSTEVDEVETLIQKYYLDILDRPPDNSGEEGWKAEIDRIVDLDIDVKEGFIALAKFFFHSEEYRLQAKTDEQYVADLYQTFLNRTPNPQELGAWVTYLTQGLSRHVIFNSFAFSDEFKMYMDETFGSGTGDPTADLLNDLYRGLQGRLPDTEGFIGWTQLMTDARSNGPQAVAALSHQIAREFLMSDEYVFSNKTDREFLEDLYNGILRRGASTAEFDAWFEKISEGLTREQILQAFTHSVEYQLRVQAVVDAENADGDSLI